MAKMASSVFVLAHFSVVSCGNIHFKDRFCQFWSWVNIYTDYRVLQSRITSCREAARLPLYNTIRSPPPPPCRESRTDGAPANIQGERRRRHVSHKYHTLFSRPKRSMILAQRFYIHISAISSSSEWNSLYLDPPLFCFHCSWFLLI